MDRQTAKKVSVAMTTFNGERHLEEQLNSILNQTVQVSEIVVCDDGSTDETVRILEKFSKFLNLRYFVNERTLGFVKNFEKAISRCTGQFIVLADQDDIWYPEKVQVLLDSIGDNLMIHSDCDLINEEGEVIARNFKGVINTHKEPQDFLFSNIVTGCTAMIHRDLLIYALPFPEGISYHDWYLAIHASYLGKLTYTSRSLTGYRQHASQDTGSGTGEKSSILRNCLKRLRGKEFGAIKSSKRQLANLRATSAVFSADPNFYHKQLGMIKILEEYVTRFFHLSYGAYYSKKIAAVDRPKLIRLFYQLKFSIG
jgi:glycosyltransferase involved in cell wall biosynthesis